MIEVEMESEEWLNEMPEACIFCNGVARHWHKTTNTPICKICSNEHDESEISNAKSPTKTIAPW